MSELKVVESRTPVFFDRFERKDENQHQTHYCPGCGHGVAHKLIAEALYDLGLQDKTIMVSPVGCSVFAYYYFDTGNVQAAHGRAPAVATALKRSNPQATVISYQGDGDLAAIGTAEIIHAANRGENITVIFVNNSIYGMTGGQMAPTTILGQNTTTSPGGRKQKRDGFPVNLSEMLAVAKGSAYIERTAVNSPANILKTKKAIAKAFRIQMEGHGFSLIEVLSPCPTNWKMEPIEACKWIDEVMAVHYPLGVLKDVTGDKRDAH